MAPKQGQPSVPALVLGGRLGSVPAPVPKQGAGGAAPAGGTGGVPLFPITLEGGLGGTTAYATESSLHPPSTGATLRPYPHPRRKARKHPPTPRVSKRRRLLSPAGCRGRSPRRGYSESPVSKTVGGRSGRDNGAGQARPFADGGRRPRQNHPSPSAGGRRSPRPLPHPPCKIRTIVL